MKIQLLATIALSFLSNIPVQGWDFTYGYKNVWDANATQYVVGQQTVRKYSEWYGTPPMSYWGPSANDVATSLTLHFSFLAPTSEISLTAQLDSANNGYGAWGSCSLWGSKDGTTWQLLLDNPTPAPGNFVQLYYNQDVPGALLGSTSFWLQARMQETGALNQAPDPSATWAQAQFSRLDPANPGNVFQLNVMEVPEPGAYQLGLGALVAVLGWRARRGLA
jgi:hypothetical protein